MNRRQITLGLFGVFALAAVYVPASVILRHERILTQGAVYRFRSRPVDPNDAFRGRYLQLGIECTTATLAAGEDPVQPRQKLCVTLRRDSDGFSRFDRAFRKPPQGQDYIRIPSSAYGYYDARNTTRTQVVHLDIPFNRYFMEESQALRAEMLYLEHSRRGRTDASLVVRVLDGGAVIEDLQIEGRPIREHLLSEPEKPAAPLPPADR